MVLSPENALRAVFGHESKRTHPEEHDHLPVALLQRRVQLLLDDLLVRVLIVEHPNVPSLFVGAVLGLVDEVLQRVDGLLLARRGQDILEDGAEVGGEDVGWHRVNMYTEKAGGGGG